MTSSTFFGPWDVSILRVHTIIGCRLTLTTSEGTSFLSFNPLAPSATFSIDHEEWTLGVKFATLDGNADKVWHDEPFRRTDRFDRHHGLVADLGATGSYYVVSSPELDDYLNLRCVNMDSKINPIPVPPPFEFTYHAYDR